MSSGIAFGKQRLGRNIKVHIVWEGYKILWNLYLRQICSLIFDCDQIRFVLKNCHHLKSVFLKILFDTFICFYFLKKTVLILVFFDLKTMDLGLILLVRNLLFQNFLRASKLHTELQFLLDMHWRLLFWWVEKSLVWLIFPLESKTQCIIFFQHLFLLITNQIFI